MANPYVAWIGKTEAGKWEVRHYFGFPLVFETELEANNVCTLVIKAWTRGKQEVQDAIKNALGVPNDY